MGSRALAEDVGTLSEMFLRRVEGPLQGDCLKAKGDGLWIDISTDEVRTAVFELAAGLMELGVKRGDRIALLAENRPQWLMADYAILCLGAVTVPVYATLIPDPIAYILRDSASVGVVVSDRVQAEKIRSIRGRCPELSFVVGMDHLGLPDVQGWEEVCRRGRERLRADPELVRREASACRPEDLATLVYTSGTTGEPKGVMLSHGNLVSNIKAVSGLADFSDRDVALSFLPLSHVLERMADFGYFGREATIAYAESIEKVPDNIMEIKPTVMASVPRLYEKMYGRVMERGQSGGAATRAIFTWAMRVAREFAAAELTTGGASAALRLRHRIAHRLVFRKILARTGGRLKFFLSGGAPLARDIAELFYGIGITILEGYGLSETSPVLTINTPDRIKLGTVGRPVPGVEVRIAEDGEILARGPNIMKGYYGKEQETAEVFEEGWFKTGDIGHLDEDGFLVITDRKKDLFKTSGGKYVAPQPLENRLKANEIVAQAVLVGNSRKFIAALLVPNLEVVRSRLSGESLPSAPEDLVRQPPVRELFQRWVDEVNTGLSRFEQIKKFELLPQEFSVEDGTLTPTLKVKRKVVAERLESIIEGFYG